MGNNDIQPVLHLRQQGTDAFPQTPFHHIADNGAANLFANRKSDTFLRISDIDQCKIPVGCTHPTAIYIAELPVSAQSVLLLQ